MIAAAQFMHFDFPRAPHAGGETVEFDQAVHERVFRMRLVARERREDQRGAARSRYKRTQFVDELRQLQLGGTEFAGAAKTVDHHETWAACLDGRRDQSEET